MVAGLEVAHPGDTPLETWRDRLDKTLSVLETTRKGLTGINWPTVASRVLTIAATPKPVREVLKTAARGGGTATASDVLRGIEILLAAKLVKLA
jgi:hypothetical protein